MENRCTGKRGLGEGDEPDTTGAREAAPAPATAAGTRQTPAASSRDDFARMLLHVALDENTRNKNFEELDRLQDGLVGNLVEQGFDRKQCDLVFEYLIDKYKRGWSLRRKPHLRREDEGSRS